MERHKQYLVSIVVPVYNEEAGISQFNNSLHKILSKLKLKFEVIYVNDGSSDKSVEVIRNFNESDVKLVSLSRNFGKEVALSAGIKNALGDCILMLDADGQHPVDLIPEFLSHYESGSSVVIGVRKNKKNKSSIDKMTSSFFYKVFNLLSRQKLVSGSTDFRLISRQVADVFNAIQESDRMTRSLIDWIGFDRSYIPFAALDRNDGKATYSRMKLMNLAFTAIISMSDKPLYIFAYMGVFISLFFGTVGLAILVEKIILQDPLGWAFSGPAMLAILIIFLVGIMLMSQAIISLYISKIFNQSKGRPLYVVDYEKSVGLTSKKIS